jgi:hypothetical protein
MTSLPNVLEHLLTLLVDVASIWPPGPLVYGRKLKSDQDIFQILSVANQGC